MGRGGRLGLCVIAHVFGRARNSSKEMGESSSGLRLVKVVWACPLGRPSRQAPPTRALCKVTCVRCTPFAGFREVQANAYRGPPVCESAFAWKGRVRLVDGQRGRTTRGRRAMRKAEDQTAQQLSLSTSSKKDRAASLIASLNVGNTWTVSIRSSSVRPCFTAKTPSWIISGARDARMWTPREVQRARVRRSPCGDEERVRLEAPLLLADLGRDNLPPPLLFHRQELDARVHLHAVLL